MDVRMRRMEALAINDATRRANGLKSLTVPLLPLRFNHSGSPWPADVAQPARLGDLAVSGSESVPGTSARSEWNCAKSRAFLANAVAGYDGESGSDGEGELGSKSRTTRLKVIEAMGASYERVIGTVYKLN